MKVKTQNLLIPLLLIIALAFSAQSCAKNDQGKGKEDQNGKENGEVTIVDTWTIEDKILIHQTGDLFEEFDLTLGVTMSVNDTILGGVILDDPLKAHPIEFNCFDPTTFTWEIKAGEICFSDSTKTTCIPTKECISFVWIWKDGRICVYINEDCDRVVNDGDGSNK